MVLTVGDVKPLDGAAVLSFAELMTLVIGAGDICLVNGHLAACAVFALQVDLETVGEHILSQDAARVQRGT